MVQGGCQLPVAKMVACWGKMVDYWKDGCLMLYDCLMEGWLPAANMAG
jgi:hypothetical protein